MTHGTGVAEGVRIAPPDASPGERNRIAGQAVIS
jgi:hypothetical protein